MDIPRDRWGRPTIIDPETGILSPYTRVSTMAKAPDDTGGLVNWASQKTVEGLVSRPDLYRLAQLPGADLKAIAKQAKDASDSDSAANMGTVLHSWTESVDLDASAIDKVPEELRPYIDAYVVATTHLTVEATELFVVNDTLRVAGSLDRLYRLPDGAVVVGDVKTGKWADTYGQGSVAIQTAMYSHGQRYDPATGERTPLHPDIDHSRNLLVHLPLLPPDAPSLARPSCTLHDLDGEAGWYGARMASAITAWRKRRDIASAHLSPAHLTPDEAAAREFSAEDFNALFA